MFKPLFRSAALAAAVLIPALSASSVLAESVDPKVAEAIKEKLNQARPGLPYGDVESTPVEGIYRVSIGGQSLYISKDGNYFFAGDLVQVTDSGFVNLTDKIRNEARVSTLKSIKLEDTITFKPEGETKKVIYVFTDIDCGYCRKLHQEVPALNQAGVEVRYLAYPRAGANSGSANKLATAWCAKDKQDALTKLKNGQTLETNACEGNPVAAQYALGSDLGVTGTPALFLEDGTLIPGYKPAAELIRGLGLGQASQ